MAIQAQYPLLQNRNFQDGKTQLCDDFSLIMSNHGGGVGGGGGGGAFMDHTNMSYNTGVWANKSTRKRGREETLIPSMQQPHFMGFGELYSGQKNVVSTGLGLAFDNQPSKQLISSQSSNHSSLMLSLFSDELGSQIKQHNDEIDHLLITQGEQLRRVVAEKRQRQYRTLLNAAEELAARRLREKEVEVGKAFRRQAELESKANQLNLESQAWQARARMQENYVATLQLQLQQAMITGGGGGGVVKGGVHVQDGDEYGGGNSTGGGDGEAEDAGSAYIDPDRVIPSGPSCKSCRNRVASMVLLPCRHLCLCTECDAVAQACPVCLTVRSSSIEVFFSL